MTNRDSVLKSRDISLLTKVHIVKAMVCSVVMYGCESWTIKKAECRRIDAFELWCWRRLLRVPWTARRSNQLILKEINPEYPLEGLMLKLHYFGYLMQWTDLLEKTLMLGKFEGRSREGRQRMRWFDGITNSFKVWCHTLMASLTLSEYYLFLLFFTVTYFPSPYIFHLFFCTNLNLIFQNFYKVFKNSFNNTSNF